MRDSYEPGGIVAGMRRKFIVIHASGRMVLADRNNGQQPSDEVRNICIEEQGTQTVLSCSGAADSGFTKQVVTLDRPGKMTLVRHTDSDQSWWCHGPVVQQGNTLSWDDGTILQLTRGTIVSFDPEGYHDEKIVGLGLLKLKDPMAVSYPLITARPENGQIIMSISLPSTWSTSK